MKISRGLLPCAALFCSVNAFAATSPVSDYLTCGAKSFSVITLAPFKSQVPQTVENGRPKLQGGTKTDLGQRWVFDKPIEADGLTFTGFFSDNMNLGGAQIISWGFYVQQTPEQVAASVKKLSAIELQKADSIFVRPEVWSESRQAWQSESAGNNAGKVTADTSERVLLIEPAPEDVKGSTGMLTCSIQGNISDAAMKSSRPDLLPAR
ncbi:hypothetical protein SAMN05444064_11466 [Pseudomonas syringae]|uniref:hypothetical protein n=1 Tax=Pseudomonas syringae TaxID=317 RepID=UPI00089561AB|nr:hypothetical protein [Pseudomonas syringae]SDX16553.1 hypothetical protein SAMN05444514_11366 [Pseudomonas syringae]SFM33039.1 hypothetical protein SAMN05444064_11466 [Pseudomonas syringae]